MWLIEIGRGSNMSRNNLSISRFTNSRFFTALFIILMLEFSIPFFDTRNSFVYLAPPYSLMIYLFLFRSTGISQSRYVRFSDLLGNSSYSTYLVHWSLGIFLINFVQHEIVKFICTSPTLMLSALAKKYFETPERLHLISILE